MPAHAASLALVREGVIGDVTSVQISSTHLYHAVSLIRQLLGVGFEEATVSRREFTAPLVDPMTPDGWTDDPDTEGRDDDVGDAGLRLGGRASTTSRTTSGGTRCAAGGIVIRGSLGEIVDDRVIRMLDPRTPVESQIVASPQRHRPQPRGQRPSAHHASTVGSSTGIPLRAIGSPRTTSRSPQSSRRRARGRATRGRRPIRSPRDCRTTGSAWRSGSPRALGRTSSQRGRRGHGDTSSPSSSVSPTPITASAPSGSTAPCATSTCWPVTSC